jgi:hypothetical protein
LIALTPARIATSKPVHPGSHLPHITAYRLLELSTLLYGGLCPINSTNSQTVPATSEIRQQLREQEQAISDLKFEYQLV